MREAQRSRRMREAYGLSRKPPNPVYRCFVSLTDDMVVAAMEKIPGCDHDLMVDALEAALLIAVKEQGSISDRVERALDRLTKFEVANKALREALHEIVRLDHHNQSPESRATKIARDALNVEFEL